MGVLTSASNSALIAVTGFYQNTVIEGNKLSGMSSGAANDCAIIVTTQGTMVRGNKINALTGGGSAGAILVTPSANGGDVMIWDNDIDCTTGPGRHINVNGGNGAGGKMHIKGGRFLGSSIIVNFDLGSANQLWFVDREYRGKHGGGCRWCCDCGGLW